MGKNQKLVLKMILSLKMFTLVQQRQSPRCFQFNPLMRQKKGRSLLERKSIRMALVPQASQKEKIQFSPEGNYDEMTNIHDIHKYVLSSFQLSMELIPEIEKKIYELEQSCQKECLRIVDLKIKQSEIKKLQKKIQILESREQEREYIERISPILEEWNELLNKNGPYFKFGEEQVFSPGKLALIRAFIQIATEYAYLNLTLKPVTISGACPYCRKQFEDEDGKVVCYDCDVYRDQLAHDAEFGDLARINGSSNNNYINRETFTKALYCYQGKQKADFAQELYTKFDEYCVFNHIVKSRLNYEHTRPIFKAIGYSSHFDNINLFLSMHPEIKRPLPDLTEFESLIIKDYDQFTQKYAELKGDQRDSALNSWYLLYILINRRNIHCEKHDLKMPDTTAIRISNDNIARKVFEALGWKFEDTI